VFATRAPARPNPIGMSVVRLRRIENNTIYIQDVDIIDQTPLLDIKPFVPDFDVRKVERAGWVEKKAINANKVSDDGRFGK
jgi:tRNA (Thr-GGU) A37 N-methylase